MSADGEVDCVRYMRRRAIREASLHTQPTEHPYSMWEFGELQWRRPLRLSAQHWPSAGVPKGREATAEFNMFPALKDEDFFSKRLTFQPDKIGRSIGVQIVQNTVAIANPVSYSETCETLGQLLGRKQNRSGSSVVLGFSKRRPYLTYI